MILLSVIIPTFRRPRHLPRAVESALSLGSGVEVIVVPNGPDSSWQQALQNLRKDPRVRISPIMSPGANAARNRGLSLASGQYVRFLDDDDYLYPTNARRQLEQMHALGATISSGHVDLVDEAGRILHVAAPPESSDIAEAMLLPGRLTLVTAHIYRTDLVRNLRWSESLDRHQDVDWMLQVCRLPCITWHRHPEPVGVWVQHHGKRVSRGRDPGPRALANSATQILALVDALHSRSELRDAHRIAAAEGAWNLVQKGLLYEIPFWCDIAKSAKELSPESRPPSAIYHLPLIRKLDPLLVAACLLPARFILRLIRLLLPATRH